jgi:DNA-binding CsgD family transcriptional regulator/tetratricopeptide (TPR) repeat protein
MKLKSLIILLLINVWVIDSYSQTYADKEYYLIDSLDLSELTEYDVQLLDSALTLYHSVKHDTDKVIAIALIQNNMAHEDWSKYNDFIKLTSERELEKPLTKDLKLFYTLHLATSINNQGLVCEDIGDLSASLKCYFESLKLFESINDKDGIATSLSNIGSSYGDQGNISKALEYALKSLEINKEINDISSMSTNLNNIGFIYASQKEYDKALKYFKKCLNIDKQQKDKSSIAYSYNNIGVIYKEQEKYNKALKNLNSSLEIREELGDNNGIIITLYNIASIHFYLGENEKAILIHNRALQISEELGFKRGISYSLVFLAKIYLNKTAYETAEKNAIQGYEISKEIKNIKLMQESARLLSEIYKKKGEYKKGWEIFETYTLLRDSMNKIDSKQMLQEMETNFELERKDQELKLNEKNITGLQKDKKIREYSIYFLIALLVLLIVLTYTGFKSYKQKKIAKEIEFKHQIDLLRANINLMISENEEEIEISEIPKDINSFLSEPLSEREMDVFNELCTGKTNKQISETLFISINTTKTHLLSIYKKMNVKNRTQAVKKNI